AAGVVGRSRRVRRMMARSLMRLHLLSLTSLRRVPGKARRSDRLAVGDVGGVVQAVGPVGAFADLAGFAALGHAAVLLADGGVAVDGDAAEAGGVAPVGVDPGQDLGGAGGDAVHDHVALVGAGAVAAGPVQLAGVVHLEVADGQRAGAVVLEDLVGGVLGAAAVDEVGGRGAGAAEGGGVLADIVPPDVPDGAGAFAVDAVSGGGVEDDVLDGAAVRDHEHRVLALALAAVADAVVALHAAVEEGADVAGGGLMDAAGVGRPRTAAVTAVTAAAAHLDELPLLVGAVEVVPLGDAGAVGS